MESCRSPREVFRRAHALGLRLWPTPHASRFGRRDFTRAQLFACLALRKFLGMSDRDAQALLADVPGWRAAIGMRDTPDHNTLWRAFGTLLKPGRLGRALDLLAADRPDKWGERVNRARHRLLRRMPKLALATAAATHQVLAAKARLGAGSDAPDFGPLLYDAWRHRGADRRRRRRSKIKGSLLIFWPIRDVLASCPSGAGQRVRRGLCQNAARAPVKGRRAL